MARHPGRRRDGAGARFDIEADAFLVLVLSVNVAVVVGPWALAIGAMRYAFVVAAAGSSWLRAPLPPSQARPVIGLSQGVGLAVAGSGLLPRTPLIAFVALLLAALCWSFGRDATRLRRARC